MPNSFFDSRKCFVNSGAGYANVFTTYALHNMYLLYPISSY